ncbi:hypothetical protein IID21_05195 [Patescibacteria group bacterium]|nr:hypothetical protein [Patescibacteria group bacterium]
MERMSAQSIESSREGRDFDMKSRVERHSQEFDNEIEGTRTYTEEEIRAEWRDEEWKVGGATVRALGVMHVPETFLEYREQIEKAIEDADLVLTEFAPEAQGFYNESQKEKLASIDSNFNQDYTLEDLRQEYMKHEIYGYRFLSP